MDCYNHLDSSCEIFPVQIENLTHSRSCQDRPALVLLYFQWYHYLICSFYLFICYFLLLNVNVKRSVSLFVSFTAFYQLLEQVLEKSKHSVNMFHFSLPLFFTYIFIYICNDLVYKISTFFSIKYHMHLFM